MIQGFSLSIRYWSNKKSMKFSSTWLKVIQYHRAHYSNKKLIVYPIFIPELVYLRLFPAIS